jgi:Mg2+-importing ATPase
MLWIFHAHATLFRSDWFVTSLAVQALVVFIVRTRRVPFWRSKPGLPPAATTVACAVVGIGLPFSPLAHLFGFTPPPVAFLGALAGMVVTYLVLAELGVALFFNLQGARSLASHGRPPRARRATQSLTLARLAAPLRTAATTGAAHPRPTDHPTRMIRSPASGRSEAAF